MKKKYFISTLIIAMVVMFTAPAMAEDWVNPMNGPEWCPECVPVHWSQMGSFNGDVWTWNEHKYYVRIVTTEGIIITYFAHEEHKQHLYGYILEKVGCSTPKEYCRFEQINE